ncbi:hypothetical protein Goarm_016968 [Gossypium armourianum]|uniref:Zinc knuckle CX2CX4HX4C domain-containing protein n=1 Tax=Gossypium armourianum TaxID=34283 RepID=A0A7J9JEM6_9ROSI|nr:hypothetical protein [Gossypium armourianum]
MAVYVDLEKPLTLQVLVNGRVQRVEFKSLLTVYFSCGWYGHLKGLCPSVVADQNSAGNKVTDFGQTTENLVSVETEKPFSAWMLVAVEQNSNSNANAVEEASNSLMHFNPTFEFPIESMVDLNSKFLDSNRHSAVTFKENSSPNVTKNSTKEGSIDFIKSSLVSIGHTLEGKCGSGCLGKALNKTIRG